MFRTTKTRAWCVVALTVGFAGSGPLAPTALAQEAEPEAVEAPSVGEGVLGDGSGEAPAEGEMTEEQIAAEKAAFEASLSFQTGTVALGEKLASVDLGSDFRMLTAADTERLLVAWGNPPGGNALGMIFPANLSPFAENSWGVVVSYEEDGHVDDEDAADINYDDLLKEMQEDTEASNEERKELGFGTVRLVGWAEPPHYDAESKKLYWAKDLDFGDGAHSLNYAVRVLGRTGVLELNAVGEVSQLPEIRAEMNKVMKRVSFEQGKRYADFLPDTDKVAAYGIGALIAGKLVAKAGLFKGLFVALLASKKLLIGGAIALAALAKRIFTGDKA